MPRTTEAICSRAMTISCCNCSRFLKVGQRYVITVSPGIVTYSHSECPLPSSLAVHHLDGNPANNDPENLEVIDVRENLNWQDRTAREARIDARRRRGYDHA